MCIYIYILFVVLSWVVLISAVNCTLSGTLNSIVTDSSSVTDDAVCICAKNNNRSSSDGNNRREVLTERFFKRHVLPSSSLLHYLLPDRRDNDTVNSLRHLQPFHKLRTHTT